MKTLDNDLNTSIEVLENLDEEFNEICEWQECEQTRTHLLACPKCPALENLCEAHADMAKLATPRDRVVFNRSCNHSVPMVACGKIRVGT